MESIHGRSSIAKMEKKINQHGGCRERERERVEEVAVLLLIKEVISLC